MPMPKPLRNWLVNSPTGRLVLSFLESYLTAFGASDPQPLRFWLGLGTAAGFLLLWANLLSGQYPALSKAAAIAGVVLLLPIGLARRLMYDYWKRLLATVLIVLIAGGLALLLTGVRRF